MAIETRTLRLVTGLGEGDGGNLVCLNVVTDTLARLKICGCALPLPKDPGGDNIIQVMVRAPYGSLGKIAQELIDAIATIPDPAYTVEQFIKNCAIN